MSDNYDEDKAMRELHEILADIQQAFEDATIRYIDGVEVDELPIEDKELVNDMNLYVLDLSEYTKSLNDQYSEGSPSKTVRVSSKLLDAIEKGED